MAVVEPRLYFAALSGCCDKVAAALHHTCHVTEDGVAFTSDTTDTLLRCREQHGWGMTALGAVCKWRCPCGEGPLDARGWPGVIALMLRVAGHHERTQEWIDTLQQIPPPSPARRALYFLVHEELYGNSTGQGVAAIAALLAYGASVSPNVMAAVIAGKSQESPSPYLFHVESLLEDAALSDDSPSAVRRLLCSDRRGHLAGAPFWELFQWLPGVVKLDRGLQRVLIAQWSSERDRRRGISRGDSHEATPPQTALRHLCGQVPRSCVAEVMLQISLR